MVEDWDNKRHICDWDDWGISGRELCGERIVLRVHAIRKMTIEAARELFAKGEEGFYCRKCQDIVNDDAELAARILAARLDRAT